MRRNENQFWASVPTNHPTNEEIEDLQSEPGSISETVRTAEDDVYTDTPVYY